MRSEGSITQEARSRAEDKFTKAKKRDAEIMKSQQKAWDIEVEKTGRLRSLRLAKESADKEASDRIAAEKAEFAKQTKASKASKSSKRP